jgi:hypothetical protein
LSPGLRLSASVKPKAKQRFGSGRHGSRLERAPCLRTYVLRIYVVRMHVDTQTDSQTDTQTDIQTDTQSYFLKGV